MAGYGVRREFLAKVGTFVRKHLLESSVDGKISGMELMTTALLCAVRRKHVKEELVK